MRMLNLLLRHNDAFVADQVEKKVVESARFPDFPNGDLEEALCSGAGHAHHDSG